MEFFRDTTHVNLLLEQTAFPIALLVGMFLQQEHALLIVELILLGVLVKFFMVLVDKELELELVQGQIAQHILR
jgi:hypothetical protein